MDTSMIPIAILSVDFYANFGMIIHTVGNFLLTKFRFIELSSTVRIGAVISTTVFSMALIIFATDVFHCPILSEAEHLNVFRLGIDTWADTACARKHAFVEECFMGKFINKKGFTTALGCL